MFVCLCLCMVGCAEDERSEEELFYSSEAISRKFCRARQTAVSVCARARACVSEKRHWKCLKPENTVLVCTVLSFSLPFFAVSFRILISLQSLLFSRQSFYGSTFYSPSLSVFLSPPLGPPAPLQEPSSLFPK